MTNVAISAALMRVADRCLQVMGARGVSEETIGELVFREVRAFRTYDGPTEVHQWSLAKKLKRDWKAAHLGNLSNHSIGPTSSIMANATPSAPGAPAFERASASA